MSLSILITCMLDDVWISKGEVTRLSLLGVKGLTLADFSPVDLAQGFILSLVRRNARPEALIMSVFPHAI